MTWPVLGYLDLLLIRVCAGRAALVIHDPEPLVRAVGLDTGSARVASICANDVVLLVHSAEARNAVEQRGFTDRVQLVAHPIEPSSKAAKGTSRIVVSVLGQWKRDRDLRLMETIATVAPGDWELRVVGRGWPKIDGWHIDNRFVSEREFDERLVESSVVLIPYTRFYQSGVAIRALEKRVPVVGPRQSALARIFGKDSNLLAGDDYEDWILAIRYAISMPQEELDTICRRYNKHTTDSWLSVVGMPHG
ncbi:hypothetical protein [Flexivirga caeni]|uniref:hypothetical protein n=1 Tax=Flexivirga caeni TaxID=2294115 RepID=UPI001FE6F2DB|nr:hypothetical protein [Flexivirga caeni]